MFMFNCPIHNFSDIIMQVTFANKYWKNESILFYCNCVSLALICKVVLHMFPVCSYFNTLGQSRWYFIFHFDKNSYIWLM